jgi:hypothetical protein
MRRVSRAAVAVLAAAAVVPSAAGAHRISLGRNLGIAYSKGHAVKVTVVRRWKPHARFARSLTSTKCAVSSALGSVGTPSCTTSAFVLPSTPAQLASGLMQLTDLSYYFRAQSASGDAAGEDQITLLNPYTGVAYQIADLTCSGTPACEQSLQLTMYNTGTQPAPTDCIAQWTLADGVKPSIRASASESNAGTLSGSVSGGVGLDGS